MKLGLAFLQTQLIGGSQNQPHRQITQKTMATETTWRYSQFPGQWSYSKPENWPGGVECKSHFKNH